MEMFYLVLIIKSGQYNAVTSVVMPEKYTNEQCQKVNEKYPNMVTCIPAPNDSEYYNCMTLIPSFDHSSAIAAKIHCDLKTGK